MKKYITVLIALGISTGSWAQATLRINGGVVHVSDGTSLVVEGNIHSTNITDVVVENNGSIIQPLDGGASNTTISPAAYHIKRNGTTTLLAYNMWSSPILAAKIQSAVPGQNTFPSTNPCDMYVFNATTQEWKYDWSVPYTTTCAGTGSVTFTAATNMTDGNADGVMDVGRGYFMPGSGTAERVFTGVINNGSFQFNIHSTSLGDKPTWHGDDWNMIGNPYPSAVSMDAFWTENAITNTSITDGLYFWVDDGSGGSGYEENNSYLIYNATGSSVGGSGGGTSQPIVTEYIASAQGFWVHASGNGSVVFKNSMRTGAGYDNTAFHKRSTDIQRAWITLRRNSGIRSNQILLGLTDEATVGYDPAYDARRMHSTQAIELSFVQDTGTLYQIIAQPTISYDEQEILPLHVHNDTSGLHSFVLDSTQNVNNGIKYYLIDSLNNTVHDLSAPYILILDTGDHENRFFLLYTDVINSVEDTKAPVFFVKAYQSGDYIKLQSNKIDITDVAIYNTVGAMVLQQNGIRNPSVEMYVGSLSKGVYLVNYTLDNGLSETQKLVIH